MLLLWHLKSYLPAHSILRGFVALHLCDFADAIRAGCAEAKRRAAPFSRVHPDAIRAGCAEAKIPHALLFPIYLDAIRAGCAEAKVEEVDRVRRVLDAIRAGCAEAKLICMPKNVMQNGCNPCGVC